MIQIMSAGCRVRLPPTLTTRRGYLQGVAVTNHRSEKDNKLEFLSMPAPASYVADLGRG